MEITLNGKTKVVVDNIQLTALIESLDISPSTVIVEHNGEILKPKSFLDVTLKNGDRLELIQIVGGG
jgi:sulfur carrier protein